MQGDMHTHTIKYLHALLLPVAALPSTSPPAAESDGAPASRSGGSHDGDVASRVHRVLAVLQDASIPEEDKPDKLSEVLAQAGDINPADLDSHVLAIMHRYREDVHPTGQAFSTPTPMARQHSSGTLSRSSSFRRTLTPTSASSLVLKRAAGMSTPTRPISPSPLRSQSPSVYAMRREYPEGAEFFLHSSSSSNAASSSPSSPFNSPRTLNATAHEFRPSITAAEFRPSSATSNRAPSLNVKMPEIRSRSPIGTPLTESSPSVWAFNNSPLGTPKFAQAGGATTPTYPPSGGLGSYFPKGGPPTATTATFPTSAGPAIPSDPWDRLGSAAASASSTPGISLSTSTASSGDSPDDIHGFDPFATAKANSGVAPDWKEASSPDDLSVNNGNVKPKWDLYQDEDEDDDLEILQFKGGQLLPETDELVIIEPTAQERPVFQEGYFPQSTSQYSQLPQNLPSPPQPAGQGLPSIYAEAPGGLGASSSNYIMTPFDVLCSIFAGSDITPVDLEEALARNGYDVDRSMEWIINNPNLPGAARDAENLVDNLNMLSVDLSGEHHAPGASSPFRRSPVPSMSGSRPNMISRDSFQRAHGPNRPGSPRWAAFGDGRPSTPSGRSDRSSDVYFNGGSATPSTRLCKYYLQGNCLRSDCRFSHDLSKAVCKFWLRGHCLKGEGRCEFLHSVPPHLANDIAVLRANALRSRDPDKGRFSRGYEEGGIEPGLSPRVEEDFPTLAAASASNAQRHGMSVAGKDPAATRWAGIVKNGRPVPVNSRPSLPKTVVGSGRPVGRDRTAPWSQPRPSPRLSLRTPTLLPTITTGVAVSRLYDKYRENFFEYGNERNKCLVGAADAWRTRNGALAKKLSQDAQIWNQKIAEEGTEVANQIVSERKRQLREAVMSASGRPGHADGTSDRGYRGQDCGAGLGVCLGVAAGGEALGPEGLRLSASERTEAVLDLHGLHPDESLEILERFLLGIESEAALRGLCFVVVGQERHTGTADTARGSRKVRLADAVGTWLDSYGYAFWLTNGIFCIDPLHHLDD